MTPLPFGNRDGATKVESEVYYVGMRCPVTILRDSPFVKRASF